MSASWMPQINEGANLPEGVSEINVTFVTSYPSDPMDHNSEHGLRTNNARPVIEQTSELNC